jgi:hypothetical protein
MSRLVILAFCLLWPATVSAGQAKAQFNVGIVITGKRASSAPTSNAPPSTEAPVTPSTKAFAKATHQRGVKDCAARYRSYDPATHTYIGRDGNARRCP